MAALALQPACKKQEPVVIDARAVVPVAAVDLAVTATPPTLPTVSPPPSTGEEPTIELSGTVQMGPAGRPRYPLSVIIASGDCASPSSRLLRRVPLGDSDGFFAVVMVSLSNCSTLASLIFSRTSLSASAVPSLELTKCPLPHSEHFCGIACAKLQ